MPIINNNTINLLLTKITARGRELMAGGDFNFRYFALGDTDINYIYDGDQKIITPMAYQKSIQDNLNTNCDLNTLPVPNKKTIKLVNRTSITNDFDNYFVASGNTINSGTNEIDLELFNLKDDDTLYVSFPDGSILTYNITTKTASSIVILDRPLPLILENIDFKIFRFNVDFLNISGDTVYYDSIEQKFKTNCNVITPCEINFSIVNQCDIMGTCDDNNEQYNINDAGCKEYIGLTKVLGYNNSCIDNETDMDCNESVLSILSNPCWVGLIHFNKEMGEQICIESGRDFSITFNDTKYITNTDEKIINSQIYHDLEDSSGNVIGRVYKNMQIVTIHDQEILTSLNPISNRSFQFPSMEARLITDRINGVLKPDQCIWMSYTLNANNYREYLPSQNILYLKNQTVTNKNVEFNFSDLTGLDDLTFGSLKLIYQITDDCSNPDPCKWKVIDFSEDVQVDGNIDLSLASEKSDYLLDNFKKLTSSDYRLSYLKSLTQKCVSKIDADFDFYIGREIYKSVFTIKVDGSSIKSSKNCTWSSGKDVILSEVGIYNENKELVLVSKLTNPITLDSSTLYNLEISVDF